MRIAAVLLLLTLAACSAGEHSVLRDTLQDINKTLTNLAVIKP